jgi:hypothetical protein
MEPYLLHATLYFVDARPPDAVRELVEQALGCRFRMYESDDHRIETLFTAAVFGMRLFFEAIDTVEGKYCYRLHGASWTSDRFPNAPKIPLDYHISELLRRVGVTDFLTRDEYANMIRSSPGSTG